MAEVTEFEETNQVVDTNEAAVAGKARKASEASFSPSQCENTVPPAFTCVICSQTKPNSEKFRGDKKCYECMTKKFADINAQLETECTRCKVTKPRETGFKTNCVVCNACKTNPINPRTKVARNRTTYATNGKPGLSRAPDASGAFSMGLCERYGPDTVACITAEQGGESRTTKIGPLKFLTNLDIQRLVNADNPDAPVFSATTYKPDLQILNDELQTMLLTGANK